MIKQIFTGLFLLVTVCTAAQQVRIEAGAGYGSFSMNGLKELNTYFLESLPVKARLTDDFPVQPFFSGALLYHAPKTMYFGPVLGFTSTGSRVSYKDFSGELFLDNILSSLNGGLRLGFTLSDKKIKVSQENDFTLAITWLKMYRKVLSQEDTRNFRSMSPQAEPGIRISSHFNRFDIGVKAGYLIDFKGKYKLSEDSDKYLISADDNKPLTNNWSGFRLGLTLGFKLLGE